MAADYIPFGQTESVNNQEARLNKKAKWIEAINKAVGEHAELASSEFDTDSKNADAAIKAKDRRRQVNRIRYQADSDMGGGFMTKAERKVFETRGDLPASMKETEEVYKKILEYDRKNPRKTIG